MDSLQQQQQFGKVNWVVDVIYFMVVIAGAARSHPLAPPRGGISPPNPWDSKIFSRNTVRTNHVQLLVRTYYVYSTYISKIRIPSTSVFRTRAARGTCQLQEALEKTRELRINSKRES